MSTEPRPEEAYDCALLQEALEGFFAPYFSRVEVLFKEVVASSNDWGKALPAAKDGLRLLLCESQSAGRGRLGRAWSSPRSGDLYMSLVMDGCFPPRAAGRLPLAMGLALQRALQPELGGELGLKWPNDLLAGGRKLAGILCESQLGEDAVRRFVVGVGLNVRRETFAGELGRSATSLRRLRPERPCLRNTLIINIMKAFAPLWPLCLRADGGAPLMAAYEAHCLSLGRALWLPDGAGGRVRAQGVGLDAEGALLARDADGRLHTIRSGELHWAD